jgi:polar amino acid transport system substrate-binding protein
MTFALRFPSTRALRATLTLLGIFISATHVSAASAACEPQKLAAKYPALAGVTVKIGQDGESPPFSYRDPKDFNKIIGLDADIARAVFACAGIPVTFTTGAWSGLIPATMAGQIDVMWDTLLYTPERAKRLDFVVYMSAVTGVMAPKGNPKNLKSLDDLCGLKITAGLGTTQEVQLREASSKCTAAGKKAIDLITAPDIPGGIRLVQNGRADAFSTNKALVSSMAEKMPGVFEVAFEIQTGSKIAAGVAKNRKDLRQVILDGLTAITADGSLKKIFETNHIDFTTAHPPEVLTE